MKLFGKELFNYKKPPVLMYDFAQHGMLEKGLTDDFFGDEMIRLTEIKSKLQGKKAKKAEEKPTIKPKELYNLSSLNKNDFVINTDETFLKDTIQDFEERADLVGLKDKKNREKVLSSGYGASRYAKVELLSMIDRLKNRYKLNDSKETSLKTIVDKYPHTSSDLINKVVTGHSNLRCKRADEFISEWPKDAKNAMKEYDDMCVKLFDQKAVFYVIADKKDFEKSTAKRDPILLAQSPFGFFWQILGAWDEEMVYLGDL